MSHCFKYIFRSLVRNKMLIFWTLAFPLILGTLFKMAFADLESNEEMDTISIGILENEQYLKKAFLREAMAALAYPEGEIFDLHSDSLDGLYDKLENEEIVGFIEVSDDEEVNLVVRTNGIKETIVLGILDEIEQLEESVMVIDEKTDMTYMEAIRVVNESAISIIDETKDNMSYTMIEFYALIAMTCLYGGILGMFAVNKCLANMSCLGKRVAISPKKKAVLVLSSSLAAYVIQVIGVVILLGYLTFVLGVDFGDKWLYVGILSLVGCVAGLSMGVCVASVLRSNEDVKMGTIIAVTMVGCFLAGMMGITMKYVVDKNIPLLNLINPASMITDGLYALYYYDTMERYIFDIGSILVFTCCLFGLAIWSLRRQRYESL